MHTKLIVFIFLFSVDLLFIVGEIKEIRFYASKNWNFSIDNPNLRGTFYKGDFGDIESNRSRVLFARPLFIVVVSILTSVVALDVWGEK